MIISRLVALVSFVALAGCTKDICNENYKPPTGPLAKHLDLVPPSAKVCGVNDGNPGSLLVSMGKDENPFVTIVNHVEDKMHWGRTHQDISNKESMSVEFRNGDDTLYVHIMSGGGGFYPQATFMFQNKSCVSADLDGTSCVGDDKLAKCDHRMLVGQPTACPAGTKCVHSGMGKTGTNKCTPVAAPAK